MRRKWISLAIASEKVHSPRWSVVRTRGTCRARCRRHGSLTARSRSTPTTVGRHAVDRGVFDRRTWNVSTLSGPLDHLRRGSTIIAERRRTRYRCAIAAMAALLVVVSAVVGSVERYVCFKFELYGDTMYRIYNSGARYRLNMWVIVSVSYLEILLCDARHHMLVVLL